MMMQGLQRIIKHQLNGFIVPLMRRSSRGSGWSQRREITSAISVPQRPPAVSRLTFILCGLFPVVQAWGPWKNEEEESSGKPKVIKNIKGLRLLNHDDKKLREDIAKADELYTSGDPVNYEKAYDLLQIHQSKMEPEILWRLARINYQRFKAVTADGRKQELLDQAHEQITQSMALDENNYANHKWLAILKNERSSRQGIKEQILESVVVKKHMEKAAELRPDDPTNIYLLGQWCFSVADIPWYQRKIAATLFATPPECTFAEAYKNFLKAELTQPGFYSMNLLMLAKTCIKLGDMEKAQEYLWELQKFKPVTRDDHDAIKEAKQLRDKYFRAQKLRDSAGSAVEEAQV